MSQPRQSDERARTTTSRTPEAPRRKKGRTSLVWALVFTAAIAGAIFGAKARRGGKETRPTVPQAPAAVPAPSQVIEAMQDLPTPTLTPSLTPTETPTPTPTPTPEIAQIQDPAYVLLRLKEAQDPQEKEALVQRLVELLWPGGKLDVKWWFKYAWPADTDPEKEFSIYENYDELFHAKRLPDGRYAFYAYPLPVVLGKIGILRLFKAYQE